MFKEVFYLIYFSILWSLIKSQETQMGTDQPEYNYTVSWYENMPVDHFSYTNGDVFDLK